MKLMSEISECTLQGTHLEAIEGLHEYPKFFQGTLQFASWLPGPSKRLGINISP
jgi:hypothetical protein